MNATQGDRRRWLGMMFALLSTPGLAAPAWEKDWWNPHPASDDLVLPLPCGGQMALRPVATPSADNWLSDQRVRVGGADDDFAYAEYLRTDYVAGSLSRQGNAAKRLYYLGKYEVTQDQYAAVMQDSCPTPSAQGSTATEKRSWFDAVEFGRRYSLWLMQHHAAKLPEEDGVRSYVRLPTEIEWEFAARGGLSVPEAEFNRPLFPMQGGVERYAWFGGPTSCDGRIKPVGLKEANPLGLYDILGNVQEIVLEPFRLSRGGRLHGQVGGYVLKGGGCTSPKGSLRTAARQEVAYFDKQQETRVPFTGFRIALAAPVVTSHQRIARYRKDLDALLQMRTAQLAEVSPVEMLDQLAEHSVDPAQQDALQRAAAAMRQELEARNGIEARAAQSLGIAAVQLGRVYRDDVTQVQKWKVVLDNCGSHEELCPSALKALQGSCAQMRLSGNAYLDVLQQAATDIEPATLKTQLDLALTRYSGQQVSMAKAAQLFLEQAQRYRTKPPKDTQAFLVQWLQGYSNSAQLVKAVTGGACDLPPTAKD